MLYPLSPIQKKILEAAGHDVNFQGDDNDVACLLGQIALNWYMEGKTSDAWQCFLNNPLSCYGATYDAWERDMNRQVQIHHEDERAAKAHEWSMGQAG